MPETPDTDYFGFTRIGEGEQLSKNGFAALDTDRVTLDDLIYALSEHTHNALPRLPDPVGAPTVAAFPTGGTLPPSTTLYYRISYLDRWGLETASSTEVAVTTAGALGNPEAPAITVESTGGTLRPGLFAYVATYVTATGGESTAGPRTEVRINEGTTNRMRIDLPAIIPGAVAIRIYRSRPGQSQYFFLTETSVATIYDEGQSEDATVTVPGFNSTNATNSVQVTVPGGALPRRVFGWRLYRSVTPGAYNGFNLVHTVVEGTTETSDDIRVTWLDQGDVLQRGEPREVSATIGGGRKIALAEMDGSLELNSIPRGAQSWSAFIGTPVAGTEYARVRVPHPISPVNISAFFLDPPTTSATGSQVAIRLVDSAGKSLSLRTDGSNGQYYVEAFPLTDAAFFEAEAGVRGGPTPAPIVTDASASNGQAVELDGAGEFVEVSAGTLDVGRYTAYFTLKATTVLPPADDITLSVLSPTRATPVLTEQVFTATGGGGATPSPYVEFGPVPFTVTGPEAVVLRVGKVLADPATYVVDSIRYEAEVPALAAGDVKMIVDVGDIPTATYTAPTRPTTPHLYFEQTHVYLTPSVNTATATLRTSDGNAVAWTASSNQTWLTITPTTGNNAQATLTFTADFAVINPGERLVATVTLAHAAATPTYASTTMSVVALKAPADMGATINVMVQF